MQIYRTWYAKNPTFISGMIGEYIESTHAFVESIEANTLDDVYLEMQAENWSPNGEARRLIEKTGLHHTSMSVGDVIEDTSTRQFYEVCSSGFQEITIKTKSFTIELDLHLNVEARSTQEVEDLISQLRYTFTDPRNGRSMPDDLVNWKIKEWN